MRSWFFALVLIAGTTSARAADAGITFFETKIRPVLVEHCQQCHGDKKQRGDFRLDTKAAMLKGGETGPSLVAGKAEQSLLIKALRHQEPKMPPKGKLPEVVIADFVKWIDMGAPDPRDGSSAPVKKEIDWVAAKSFWSFQLPKKSEPPKVANAGWAKTSIDRFLLAKLEAEKLQPVKAANKRDLLRRANFDLIGLPPTPEEMDAFLQDTSPNAFDKVIDRLLASPHYGERWGRYWLDVARYAEDQAHTFGVKPNTNAWRYRDWVIQAFNDDMPYDRFVKLQIAADLIEKDGPARLQHLPALGFFGLGAQYYKNTDRLKAIADELDDRVDTLTRGFLGLTVSCARCHDHKFDPIPTQDYYSLAGVFSSCNLTDVALASKEQQEKFKTHQDRVKKVQAEMQTFVQAERTKLAESRVGDVSRYLLASWQFQMTKREQPKWLPKDQAKSAKLDAAVLDRCVKYFDSAPEAVSPAAWKKLDPKEEKQASELAVAFETKVREALSERESKKPLDKSKTNLLAGLFGEKGVFAPTDDELKAKLPADKQTRLEQMKTAVATLQKDDAAKPLPTAHALADAGVADLKVYLRGNPANLGEVAPRRFLRVIRDNPPPFKQGSGRLELADAIASADNPLTARVMVNRVWQYHFGKALVGTPSNFGQLGERPSHPELLDDLAVRFVESGWSIKFLHREIMKSAAYQMSSEPEPANFTRDGDNRFYWRMNRRRLDVESWRDAMLSVSGKLNPTPGGPTFDLSSNAPRRTVYAKVSRHNLNDFLRLFDFPDANITSERRSETTVPQQQLFVINSAFVVDMARGLAARMQEEKGDDTARVQRGFRLAFARSAEPDEVRDALAFLSSADDNKEQSINLLTRWQRFAQVLIGSNEFLYVD